MGLVLVCVSALLGVVRYESQLVTKIHPAELLVGGEYRITAELTEYPAVYEDYTRFTVIPETEGVPRTKLLIYDYAPTDRDWKPGDRIRTLVKFSSALQSAGDTTDSYISKGIYLRGYARETVLFAGVCDDNWKYSPLYLGKEIRDRLDAVMTPGTSAFMKALLTGEKTDLYGQPEIYHTIVRSGISHVVAVSGMHVSFLVGVMVVLFGSGRGWLLSVGFAALFAIMTGLSPSVVRAFLMQTLFLIAPLVRRESDSVTSICFPLLVLLIINPFSIASISLQLSFGAMWGIVLVTPRALAWFKEKGVRFSGMAQRVYRFITSSFAMSLGATVFTMPLCAYYFGNIAVLSPLTNLLVLWLVPMCFAGGFGVFALSFLSETLAGVCGMVLSWAVEVIFALATVVANIPFAVVYLPGIFLILWILVTYLLFGVTYFIKAEHLYRPVFAVTVSLGLLLVMAVGVKLYYSQGVTVGAVDVGQGQSIVLMDGEATLVVDCGGTYDAGERAAAYLYSHGRNEVDMLLLTHFDRDHVNGVVDLMIQVPVKELVFCGTVIEPEEAEAFRRVQDQAQRSGTELCVMNRSGVLKCGEIHVNIFVTEDGLAALAQTGDFEMLITGDAGWRAEEELVRTQQFKEVDCLTVGHHGSRYSTSNVMLDEVRPEFALISCGYNTYGHPSDEVLDRLEQRNVIIYRTDELGNITLKVR